VASSLRVRLRFFLKSVFLWHRYLVTVIGLGQKSMKLVRAELRRKPATWWAKRASVVVIEPDEDNQQLVQTESQGARVWIGDCRVIVEPRNRIF